jgi:hypothetical protein
VKSVAPSLLQPGSKIPFSHLEHAVTVAVVVDDGVHGQRRETVNRFGASELFIGK